MRRIRARGVPYVAGWGGLLVVAAVGLVIWGDDWLPVVLLAAAGTGAIAIAASATGARARRAPAQPVSVPTLSFSATLCAAGLALLLIGASFGLLVVLVGAGVTIVAVGGLVRELVTTRRDLKGGG